MEFNELLPEIILKAVSKQGYQPTGVFYPLNSYENRVYEISLEGQEAIIGKFYRPDRWDAATIAEEHQLLQNLSEAEIPVINSLPLKQPVQENHHIGKVEGLYYSLFPKFRGRQHSENSPEELEQLGRTLARLHNVGENFLAPNRKILNPKTFGWEYLKIILKFDYLPIDLKKNIETLLTQCLQSIEIAFKPNYPNIVVHGDCHPGNILWNLDGPHLLDFDDILKAPAVQDLWMLFFGNLEDQHRQKEAFFKGYETFRTFDDASFQLTEALRTLRMIRHTGWIGQRFKETIFKRTFPYFSQRRYWEEFILSMKEQLALLQGSF